MSENEFFSYSPLNDEKSGPFRNMTKSEVESLIEKAHKAYADWSRTDIDKRLSYMKNILKTLRENADYYSELIHKDNGKSLNEALTTEIFIIATCLDYYIKNAKKILKDEKVPIPYYFTGKKGYIRYEPLGVVGVIGPWNYPLNLTFIPVLSAIISGNTVVLKHSSQTPYAGTIIEDIALKSGLPDGVVNVVWGKGSAGEFIALGNIQKLFFTGSTEIGRQLSKICAERLIPIELELGGSDAAIILDNADLKRSARGVVWGSLLNSGQTCVSIERVYVTKNRHDEFVSYLKEFIKDIKMGPDEDCDIGAMTSKQQMEIVKKQLDDAVKNGAEILAGGNIKDNYFEPTLITGCTNEMDIVKEETFGPVITVIKTLDDEESLKLANDSRYGLSSSIYGKGKTAAEFVRKIKAGTVVVNNSILSLAVAPLPFGGVKESGIGRYHGKEGLRTFCNIKSVLKDNLTFIDDFAWAPYGKNAYKNTLRFIKKSFGTRNPFKIFYTLPLVFKKPRK